MNRHLGVLLDWSWVDLIVLGIAIQQYVSISREIKRDKAKNAENPTPSLRGAQRRSNPEPDGYTSETRPPV
jgi:hypothetical protein